MSLSDKIIHNELHVDEVKETIVGLKKELLGDGSYFSEEDKNDIEEAIDKAFGKKLI